jgi:hypothetical protein
MKSNKLAFAASAVVLALWASNAKATTEIAYRFEKLNFSLTAAQQETNIPETSYGNDDAATIKTSKITNKDLLRFLATAFDTNWPAGAQLALDNLRRDIFVVDETGTNPVFNVSTGINIGDTNVVYFSFDSDRAVVSSQSVSLEMTKELLRVAAGTDFGKIFFHLFNEQNGITNTDLYFDGLNTIKFHSNMASTTNEITEQGTTSEQAPVTGDGTFNDEWTVVKGKVTGSMKWDSPIPNPALPNPVQPFTNIFTPPTNWPPPILFTNIPIRRLPTNWPPTIIITNIFPFTNIFIITNRPPPGFYPTTNPPPQIIILNPQAKTQTPVGWCHRVAMAASRVVAQRKAPPGAEYL